jgi:hypothetical protein
MARQRGRVVLRRIDDRRRRGICFRKRRAGLVKKAEELAVLCDADVALLVVSPFDGTFQRFAAPATYVSPRLPLFSSGDLLLSLRIKLPNCLQKHSLSFSRENAWFAGRHLTLAAAS